MFKERLPAGAAAVLINQSHTDKDLFMPIDAVEKCLLDEIDGHRSIGDLAEAALPPSLTSSPHEIARSFFERLWQYDQVVFDSSARRAGDAPIQMVRTVMNTPKTLDVQSDTPHPGMTWIPGGTFRMGSQDFYREEGPVHEVTVDGFWMDCYEVTNDEFARFAAETGYVGRSPNAHPRPKIFPALQRENLVPGSIGLPEENGSSRPP